MTRSVTIAEAPAVVAQRLERCPEWRQGGHDVGEAIPHAEIDRPPAT